MMLFTAPFGAPLTADFPLWGKGYRSWIFSFPNPFSPFTSLCFFPGVLKGRFCNGS